MDHSSNHKAKISKRSRLTLPGTAVRATHTSIGRKHAQLRAQHEASRFQLVDTELDLAITFCQMAADTNNQIRFDRNVAHAKRAYATAQYFYAGNLPDAQSLREKVAYLEFLLEALHVQVQREQPTSRA